MMKNTSQTSLIDDWMWLGIICFFFFQLLTDFVAAVYAFGLLGTDIPPEIATVLVLFSPVLLLRFRRAPRQSMLLGLILLTGIMEGLLDTRGRMLVSGLGVGACLMWLPVWLYDRAHAENTLDLGLGVTIGLALLILVHKMNPNTRLGWSMTAALTGGWSYWRWTRRPSQTTSV